MNRHDHQADSQIAASNPAASGAAARTELYEAVRRHVEAGRLIEAQICCQQALTLAPDDADNLYLMGLIVLERGQNDHAVEWLVRAVGRMPSAKYVASLGTALHRLGRLEEASKAFDKAVQLEPDNATAWNHLANVLFDQQRLDEALLVYRHVLTLEPRHGDAAFRCGFVLRERQRFDEALTWFDLCDELHPGHAAVLEQRGLVLIGLKRFEQALADLRRAHALKPASPEICNNIGTSLHLLRRDDEALLWFDKAIALRSDFVIALVNKALSLTELRRLDEAMAIFRHVGTIDPGNVDAAWNLALLQLMIGDLAAGFAGREVRWKGPMRSSFYPDFSEQMWLGEGSVEGRTILVHEDEGLGDTLQFVRYMPMLAARGAHVILVVREPLHRLLSGLPGIARCLVKSGAPLPAFDLHCPICSLPLAFGTLLDTIPSEVPYLPEPVESFVKAWEARLGPRRKPRVGLVWSGNPNQTNDHNRSIPLQTFLPLLDVDATFVSLQKDPRPADRAVLERSGIVDLTARLTDFAETAALLRGLDLVITVCTSVAHLAGALGCPTWTLLCHVADFRWLLDREDSPWYPTMRLFRQGPNRSWEEVLERVRSELEALIASSRS